MSLYAASGPGTDTLVVGDEGGFVILRFKQPVMWVKLDPPTALRVGEAMSRSSYRAKFGDTPTPLANKQITEQIRVRLINTATLIVRTGVADCSDAKVIAQRVVDNCLRELA